MKNNNEEAWKDVSGYEGLYQVSNQGRVKSFKQEKERILKPVRDTCGYLRVILCKNGKRKMCSIHRLVALTFIPNKDNFTEVNHKDEIKTNNNIENLEWCDKKYNNNYGTRIQRAVEKISKPVFQYTKDGKFVREWKSTMDVKRNLGYYRGIISECCLGKRKSAYGFLWKYKNS